MRNGNKLFLGLTLIVVACLVLQFGLTYTLAVHTKNQKATIDKYERAFESCQVEFTMEGSAYVFICEKNLFELEFEGKE